MSGIAVIAILAFLFFPGQGGNDSAEPVDTSTPTISAWNETSKPTTPPPPSPSNTPSSPQPSGGVPVQCADGDPFSRQSTDISGKIVGGNLSAKQIPDWNVSDLDLSFAYDVQAQRHFISLEWFNDIAVGALRMADGFEEPRQSAETVMQCLASSDFYRDFTGRTDLVSEAVTISGKPGWRIRSEVRVAQSGGIEGDVVEVIVVDPQSGEHLSLFQSAATIGRKDVQELVDAAAASLQVV